ncbi:hypothetical protein AB595_08985 [Massilia sp. WF1]|uniref:hypothetical protein n=1 Tax=unclassified Massilia TaxID=2609279 RepID=UPI0006496A63|nr:MULTISPECIES: hypothetical protein [unclassified Massilia]ALK96032.1 hypothetical protein AM586_06785 [Massilia sp. WG5]KLU37386.1 hypothetical protein AB595_08985 [Massilia sp. WF1]
METTLRTTTAGGAGGLLGTRGTASTGLAPASTTEAASAGKAAPATVSPTLRSNPAGIGGALQDQVARAQQALDYLGRVASQLETLKSELSSKLAGSRASAPPQLDAHVRQLASTLAARKQSAGGGVDANLNFSNRPATQRFRIRSLDIDSLQQGGPQNLAFSVGGNGGPQLSVNVDPSQSKADIAAAIDRAMAPLGVRAGLDNQGALVFSTPESNWPTVKDSIAVSGRGRVATEEIPPTILPQQWNVGGNGDGLRQSLREVVQALERVHRSQDAASNALSAASAEMSAATTPPPEVEEAVQGFADTAANPDYESLLALTSALVGVSRERVLALLGLR